MGNYLIRVDDLCPTMHRQRWQRLVALFRQYDIRPILAIVPENVDPSLIVAEQDPNFWDQMRTLQSEGWTIAMHGYRHDCKATGESLVPLYRRSEFAGLPEDLQLRMLQEGQRILRDHGLEPKVWVAPRHGLDRLTLRSLKQIGIHTVSDGYFRYPFLEDGLFWIPQQLGSPREMAVGLWTICLHPNTTCDHDISILDSFLARHANEFTTVDQVKQRWGNRQKDFSDAAYYYSWWWTRNIRNHVRTGIRLMRGA